MRATRFQWAHFLHEAGSKVGPFGNRRPLARNHNQAHVEPAGGAVHHLLQQHGRRNYCLHSNRPPDYSASHHQATAADAGNDRSTTAHARDTGALRAGPTAGFPGNHAPLPGGRRKPCGLSWTTGHPDANSVRPIPRPYPDAVFQARQPGGPGREILRLDTSFPHIHRRAIGRFIPLDGSVRTRPQQCGYAGPGFRLHVATAENDDDSVNGSSSVHEPDDDAVADAADDCLLFIYLAERTVSVLDCFQRDRHRNPVFHHWLAAHFPVVPKGGAGACCGARFVARLR